jgi:hypothetical protein
MNDTEAHPTGKPVRRPPLDRGRAHSVLNRCCLLATSGRSGPSCRWKGAREISRSSTLPSTVSCDVVGARGR